MAKIIKRTVTTIIVLSMLLTPVLIPSAKTTSFVDVPNGKYYTEAVKYVTDKGYFSGTGNGYFSPDAKMTRAMFVTVLAALSKDDLSKYTTSSFTDVQVGKWYAKAVAWAVDAGVASGTGNGIFSPNKNITRQEVCVMIIKFSEYKGFVPREVGNHSEKFNDDNLIAAWAKNAVYKNYKYEIVSGNPGNLFNPKGLATRAQIAVMIRKLALAMETAYRIKVKNIDVKIDGLTKKYNFLQMSDSHLTLTDETDLPAAVLNMNTRGAAFLADTTDGVKAEDRFDDMLDYAKEQKVDFVAMTGDIIDAPSNGNINYLADGFTKRSLTPLYILGNHDWTGDWIGDYQSDNQRSLNIPKLVNSGIMISGEDGSSVRDYGDFVILTIDNSNDQINATQFGLLSYYINQEIPIILMLHVPMDVSTFQEATTNKWGRCILMGNSCLSPNNYTKLFINLVKSESSTVVAVFAGHIHIDHEDVINEFTGAKQYSLGASFLGYTALVNIHG